MFAQGFQALYCERPIVFGLFSFIASFNRGLAYRFKTRPLEFRLRRLKAAFLALMSQVFLDR